MSGLASNARAALRSSSVSYAGRLDGPDPRQHLVPEHFERTHQSIRIVRIRSLEHQVNYRSTRLVSTLPNLLYHGIRAADEICRQHAANKGWSRFARYVARVELQQAIADGGVQRKIVRRRPLRFQRVPSLLVAFRQQDVRSINDLLRRRLPAVVSTCIAVIPGRPANDGERAISNTETEAMTRRYLARFATTPEGVGWWVWLL